MSKDYSGVIKKREDAAKKAQKVKKTLSYVEYDIVDDDIILRTGQYRNQSVRYLWTVGANERDYIITNIWFRNDPEVSRIINELCC